MSLREVYEKKYGKDLDWDNIEDLIKKTIKKHNKKISKEYIDKTTLTSGQFIGDKRVVDLIKNTPLNFKK
jgi:hypothetical protein